MQIVAEPQQINQVNAIENIKILAVVFRLKSRKKQQSNNNIRHRQEEITN